LFPHCLPVVVLLQASPHYSASGTDSNGQGFAAQSASGQAPSASSLSIAVSGATLVIYGNFMAGNMTQFNS
jgi:hypothetical protein